jgi:NADH:ubiquinone oxidoreductase subunit 2 (subunit N)
MKKLILVFGGLIAFIANNEILTLLLLALALIALAVFILAAWAKTEKPKMDGSFDVDWGKK